MRKNKCVFEILLSAISLRLTAIRYPLFFLLTLIFTSCASRPPNIQPQINSLIVANKPQRALEVLNSQQGVYGANNELLFILDKAFVLQLTKNYSQSIDSFEKAKLKFDQLYTQSISKGIATWLINDYRAPYHGEDFEHVLVNIFQALNFAALSDFDEALVEARDVDSKLAMINSQYSQKQKNVYKEDAFARLLMGILYEVSGTTQDYNDAFISYSNALQTYSEDYQRNYGIGIPSILKENILGAAQFMGPDEFAQAREQFSNVPMLSLEEKRKKAQIYLIQYNGISPIKIQNSIPIPLPGGYITKLAFPVYHERYFEIKTSRLTAESSTRKLKSDTELVEDIRAIAKKNLENRKFRVYAKAVARPAGKYFAERAGESAIRDQYGNDAAVGFQLLSSIFNIYSEQADLRSWQTLPAEIRMSHLVLDPQEYHLILDNFDENNILVEQRDLGRVNLKAGEVKFMIVRTVH